jgi:hypothetical protein
MVWLDEVTVMELFVSNSSGNGIYVEAFFTNGYHKTLENVVVVAMELRNR